MGAAVSLFKAVSSGAAYDDTAIQALVATNTAKADGADRVLKAGDTMTGALELQQSSGDTNLSVKLNHNDNTGITSALLKRLALVVGDNSAVVITHSAANGNLVTIGGDGTMPGKMYLTNKDRSAGVAIVPDPDTPSDYELVLPINAPSTNDTLKRKADGTFEFANPLWATGGALSGNLLVETDGALVSVDNTATTSPLAGVDMLQSGVRRGYLYFHNVNNTLNLRRYAADGTTIESETVYGGNFVSTKIGTTPVLVASIESDGPRIQVRGEGTKSGGIMLREGAANGVNSVRIIAPDSLAASYTVRLPDVAPVAGNILAITALNEFSWVSQSVYGQHYQENQLATYTKAGSGIETVSSMTPTIVNTGKYQIQCNCASERSGEDISMYLYIDNVLARGVTIVPVATGGSPTELSLRHTLDLTAGATPVIDIRVGGAGSAQPVIEDLLLQFYRVS